MKVILRLHFRASVVLLGLLMAFPAAAAGTGGRWWWDAQLRAQQESRQFYRGDTQTRDYKILRYGLGLGINGYIYHPAIASFRVELDFLATQYSAAGRRKQDNTGLGVEFNLVPNGRYPFTVRYKEYLFDLGVRTGGDQPIWVYDTGTVWSANWAARAGPLRGLRYNTSNSAYRFLDEDLGRDVRSRDRVSWNRLFGRLKHRLQLENRVRDSARSLLTTEDLVLRLTEQLDLSDRWRWNLHGNGRINDSTIALQPFPSQRRYSLRNQFQRTDPKYSISLESTAETVREDHDGRLSAYSGAVRHTRRISDDLSLTGSFSYRTVQGDDFSSHGPNLSARGSWRGRAGSFQSSLDFSADYTVAVAERDTMNTKLDQFGYSGILKMRHLPAGGSSKELTIEQTKNDFQEIFDTGPNLPGPGFLTPELRTFDVFRTEFSLGKQLDRRRVQLNTDYTRRISTDSALTGLPWQRDNVVSLRANVTQGALNFRLSSRWQDQTLNSTLGDRHFNETQARVQWRPRIRMSLNGSYQQQTRDSLSSARFVTDSYEAGFSWSVFVLDFNIVAYEARGSSFGAEDYLDRGVRWTLSSRMAGWLPVVTGHRGNGVIR